MSNNVKFGLVMGALCLALVCFFYLDKRPDKTANAVTTVPSTSGEVFKPDLKQWYTERHASQQNRFWLAGNEPIEQAGPTVISWGDAVRGLLREYADHNDWTRKIFGEFQDFSPSLYQGTQSLIITQTTKLLSLEVSLVSGEFAARTNFDMQAMFYRQDWQAIVAMAMDMPRCLTLATMYHEMGHAYKHKVEHAASATAPPTSNLYVAEEIEMHELEKTLLERCTQGKKAELHNKILDRAGSAASYQAAIAAITPQDLDEYDAILNAQNAGGKLTGLYIAGLMVDLGTEWIDRHVPAGDRAKAKIGMYFWVTKVFR